MAVSDTTKYTDCGPAYMRICVGRPTKFKIHIGLVLIYVHHNSKMKCKKEFHTTGRGK